MYYLTAPYDPERLRKWLQAPSEKFKNAMEMLIVAFSRLGFGDVPHWLEQTPRQMLEQTQGNLHITFNQPGTYTKPIVIAQRVLETVVDGPELDSIVEVYAPPDSEDESSMIDEEEMEADLS